VKFSSNFSAIYTKWCAQTYPSIFGLFAIFDRDCATIVAPPSNKNEKEQSILKKPLKTASKSTHKQYFFGLCPNAHAHQA